MITSGRLRYVGHVARMGNRRQACSVNVGKPGGKKLLGKTGCRCKDNIRMDRKEDE